MVTVVNITVYFNIVACAAIARSLFILFFPLFRLFIPSLMMSLGYNENTLYLYLFIINFNEIGSSLN